MTQAYETMEGKVCVVTGASSGIGRATAVSLAKLGAKVVMICRDQAKGEAVKGEIESTYPAYSPALLLCDLSSQSSTRAVAQALQEHYPSIQVLINNAGISTNRSSMTEDGIETTFAVNYLAAFLLTNLLLERLKASSPARIVNVASMLHDPLDFADLQSNQQFRRAYGRSKFALILFTYELARRLEGTGVTANCLNPGFVASNLGRDYSSLTRWLVQRVGSSPEKGARTSLYLASSSKVQGISGKYFSDCRVVKSKPSTYDEAAAQQLWKASADLVGLPSDVTQRT